MTPLDEIALAAAGFGAGLTGSIAGLASLVSYPALLAVGLGPVTANMTNTVALVFSSVGSVQGSRPELVGQSARLRRMAPVAAAGGVLGAVALMLTPASAFARVVPWLIAFAAAVIVLPRRRREAVVDHHLRADPIWVLVALFAVSFYGGYFGAAAGVLLLALLLAAGSDTLAHSNATKNVLLGLANAIAAVYFIGFGSVQWSAAIPLAVGCLIGGRLGPLIVRRLPPQPLRIAIGVAGLGLAITLGYQAYH
jgi:uncharacterized membrane protein YfcA